MDQFLPTFAICTNCGFHIPAREWDINNTDHFTWQWYVITPKHPYPNGIPVPSSNCKEKLDATLPYLSKLEQEAQKKILKELTSENLMICPDLNEFDYFFQV